MKRFLSKLALPYGVTCIYWENCSGDCGGSWGGKEENRGSNFFWFNHSTHRSPFHPSLKIMGILGRDVGHRRVHEGWGDRIDPHTPVSPFPSQRTGQVMQRSLGDVVCVRRHLLTPEEARGWRTLRSFDGQKSPAEQKAQRAKEKLLDETAKDPRSYIRCALGREARRPAQRAQVLQRVPGGAFVAPEVLRVE